ncbi:hypothetical protein [Botrimarina mediterranea]|uniref:hypothetical protein n=1 Tax=Botrimarina mediterranea TaxID=2528022 RepID=UPI001189A6AA|nr:hypothetical protein K2D_10820 [Planctomycetes bacterium K2D]
MRMAVGALLGLIAGTAVVAAIGLAFNNFAYLGALVAGVLAGVLMRAVTGQGGPIYAKGALAAMATAAAAILGPFLQTQWFRAQVDAKAAIPTAVASRDADADAPAGDPAAEGSDVAIDDRSRMSDGIALGAPFRATEREPYVRADVACLVIGCLAAYQIGKGVQPATIEEEASVEEPRQEPSPLPPVD